MAKLQLLQSKLEQTSLSPEPQSSLADQGDIAKTLQASASSEQGAGQQRVPQKYSFNWRSHASDLRHGAQTLLANAARNRLYRSTLWQRTLSGPAPDRLLVTPRSYYPKSAAEAEMMLMGRFRLQGGEAATRDGSPFFVQAPSELWSESLHGFHWLRHFDAGGSEPFQEHLRQLIAHWARNYGDWHDVAWRPHVIARRLMTWSSFGRLVLANSDVLFRSRVLLTMSRQARHLAKTAHLAPPGLPRLTAAIGLVQSGVCLPDGDSRITAGLHRLAEELAVQIVPDGGHVSRNPEAVLEVASDLLCLVDAMLQRDLIIPVTIRRALDRMMPMIRFTLHADGRPAVFHGGSEAFDGWAVTLLMHDSGRSKPVLQSTQSGYQRVSCGTTLLIADAGALPPSEMSTEAHAGTLSFELSAGPERIIVNCGTSRTKGSEWQGAMRATAAHSTLSIADASSAHVVTADLPLRLLGPRLLDGPGHVECKRRESEDGIWLDLSQNGYVPNFGLLHERRIYVSHDGGDIRGEDRLTSQVQRTTTEDYTVRFHLHPNVRVMRAGKGVILTLPSGATWRFSTDNALDVTESVYLASANQIRKTQQIVLGGIIQNKPLAIKWALKRATAHEPGAPPAH